MDLNRLLVEENISQYRLSKLSDVPQTTISDICSNKTNIEKCSALTLYKLAKSLNVSMEDFLNKEFDDISLKKFDTFKSNVCHEYKSSNPLDFINSMVESEKIHQLFKQKEYAKCFYLVGFLDYVCKKEKLPRIKEFNIYRNKSLYFTLFPESIIVLDKIYHTNKNRQKALKEAIPEFKHFNIIEKDIENVA